MTHRGVSKNGSAGASFRLRAISRMVRSGSVRHIAAKTPSRGCCECLDPSSPAFSQYAKMASMRRAHLGQAIVKAAQHDEPGGVVVSSRIIGQRSEYLYLMASDSSPKVLVTGRGIDLLREPQKRKARAESSARNIGRSLRANSIHCLAKQTSCQVGVPFECSRRRCTHKPGRGSGYRRGSCRRRQTVPSLRQGIALLARDRCPPCGGRRAWQCSCPPFPGRWRRRTVRLRSD